jgi:hypothetical protein
MTRLAGWAMALWAWAMLAPGVAVAQGFDVLGQLEDKATEAVEEQDAEQQARLERFRAMQSVKGARVIVLPWPDAPVDEDHILFQALVRNQIGRPNAKFFPAIDLYQEGRRVLRLDGAPVQPVTRQPGRVPPEVIQQMRMSADKLRARLGARTDDPTIAEDGKALIDDLWFVDGPETRQLAFDLYVTVAQAVSDRQDMVPPFFRMVGERPVSYYAYLAAGMLFEENQLGLSELRTRLPASGHGVEDIKLWLRYLEDGTIPLIPVSFHDGGLFDGERFAREYTVMINGLERTVPDTGVLELPRGRFFISLEREKGYGMSERVELQRLDDKVFFVVESAKGKMGQDLLFRLTGGPPVCAPFLDEMTRSNLATYAALHPNEEIFIAIPKAGSAYDPWVWTWDRKDATLKLVVDRNRGFPVRFALLTGMGMGFNSATLDTEAYESLLEPASAADPSSILSGAGSPLKLAAASLPIDFQLRGHFNRLMFGFGVQFAANLTKEGPGGEGMWADQYQVDGADGNVVVDLTPDEDLLDPGGAERPLKERKFSRLTYGLLGVVLGKNAAFGLGPRGFLRVGSLNLPHALELSGHIGMTQDPSFGKKEPKGRVTALIDLDLFAGAYVPSGDTLFVTSRNTGTTWTASGYEPRILPQFGFTLGAGFTF